MPALLLLATVLGLLAALAASVILRRHRPARARGLVRVAAAWAGVYLAALLVVSLASHERTLAVGEREAFCGFYLDCHLGVAVEDVEREALADGRQRLLVVLRVSSDARRVPLALVAPEAVVVDAQGRRYGRDRAAEEALAADRPAAPLTRQVAAGDAFLTTLAYTLPAGVERPRLRVTEGYGVDRVIEAFLLGDEDSLLHALTLHALERA